jgi:hypothetical protein
LSWAGSTFCSVLNPAFSSQYTKDLRHVHRPYIISRRDANGLDHHAATKSRSSLLALMTLVILPWGTLPCAEICNSVAIVHVLTPVVENPRGIPSHSCKSSPYMSFTIITFAGSGMHWDSHLGQETHSDFPFPCFELLARLQQQQSISSHAATYFLRETISLPSLS